MIYIMQEPGISNNSLLLEANLDVHKLFGEIN